MKTMKDIIIKDSKIQGKGVFANRDFKKGEIVIKHNLKELTKKEFEDLSEKEKHYIEYRNRKYWLFLPPARFVNHSCDANTTIKNHCDVAIRNIKKGEEITGDYSEENIPGLNMKCRCGCKNCKGIIKHENSYKRIQGKA